MSFPRSVFPIFQMQRVFGLAEFLSTLNTVEAIKSLAEGPKCGEWSVVIQHHYPHPPLLKTHRSTTTLPRESFLLQHQTSHLQVGFQMARVTK